MKKIFCVLGAAALVVVVCNTAIAQISTEQIEELRKAAEQGDARA